MAREWLARACIACTLVYSAIVYSSSPREFKNSYQDGYVLTLWDPVYTDSQLLQITQNIKDSGARHVSVAYFGCQTDIKSTDVGACELMPYENTLRAVEKAQQAGLDASILPLMGSKDWKWRGYFDPANVQQWFANYTKWISKIAADAERLKLKELVVGSEFSILQKYSDNWRAVIQAVKNIYSGPIIYTANWNSLKIGFWDATDAIGISAYFSLSNAPNPSQKELNDSWQQLKQALLVLAKQYSRPIHITEFGYTNSHTAASSPWYTPREAKRDDLLQAKCFRAFRMAWQNERTLVRASVWATSGFKETREISANPLGRPSEEILSPYFETRDLLD